MAKAKVKLKPKPVLVNTPAVIELDKDVYAEIRAYEEKVGHRWWKDAVKGESWESFKKGLAAGNRPPKPLKDPSELPDLKKLANNAVQTSKAAPTPKVSTEPKKREGKPQIATQIGSDVFGFRLGSGAAIINTGISDKPKTADQIAKDSNAPRAVGGHLNKLVEMKYLVKEGDGKTATYKWNSQALALLKMKGSK